MGGLLACNHNHCARQRATVATSQNSQQVLLGVGVTLAAGADQIRKENKKKGCHRQIRIGACSGRERVGWLHNLSQLVCIYGNLGAFSSQLKGLILAQAMEKTRGDLVVTPALLIN